MQLCKGGELHTSFEDSSEGKSYTYGDVGRIAVCMLVLADAMHSRGLVHCAIPPMCCASAAAFPFGVMSKPVP